VPPFEEVASNPCSCANAILPSLRPSYEELIRRIDLRGESSKKVAQDLGMTRNNVRVLYIEHAKSTSAVSTFLRSVL
jgi:DNA-directed RNA polymerase subunit N (RpoN/RPB10)